MANTSLTGSSTVGASQGVQLTPQNKNEQIGRDEFLKLLVTQLKNQDPEAPMDSKEFAVQLAQFTQVEKLISIDERLGAQSESANLGSMAGYLGNQVILNSQAVSVKDAQAGQIQLNMSRGASGATVQFLNGQGGVVGEKQLGPLNAGKQLVSLDGLTIPDGTYSVKVKAFNQVGGGTFEPSVAVAGLVTGFIPGPTPKLIVGGREVNVSDVQEVTVANPVG